MLTARFHSKDFPPNCLQLTWPSHCTTYTNKEERGPGSIFGWPNLCLNPILLPHAPVLSLEWHLISVAREGCKSTGYKRRIGPFVSSAKIINEAEAGGTAHTRTITNELFWERLMLKLGGWKEGENLPLTTNIHLAREERRKGKEKHAVYSPQRPSIQSHHPSLHHPYTTRHLLVCRGLLKMLLCNSSPSLSEHKGSAAISPCNIKNKYTGAVILLT